MFLEIFKIDYIYIFLFCGVTCIAIAIYLQFSFPIFKPKNIQHKKIILIQFMLMLSILFGQQFSNVSLLDKDGAQYDLSQKMSINMQDSDIKNVLMLIGELTGLNIVVSPSVKDTITANLENVSVKAALDVILKPNGYSYFTQENIIIVKGADNEIVRELETLVLKLK